MGEAPTGQQQNYKKKTARFEPDFPGTSRRADPQYGNGRLRINPRSESRGRQRPHNQPVVTG